MAQDATAPLGGELALRTDYVFRGITQTGGRVQLQGEFSWTHESGFYAGVWSTNTQAGGPGNSLELDPYVGYAASIGDTAWSYDIGYWQYTYPGAELDLDFGEFYVLTTYENWPLSFEVRLWYARDYFGSDFFQDASSLAYAGVLGYDFGIVELSARYGEQTFDEPADLPDQNYFFYDIRLSRTWRDLTFELAWHSTSGVRPELAPAADVDSRWVFGVTRSF